MVARSRGPAVLSEFAPAYLAPAVRGSLSERVGRALRELECCCACPRNCRADRTERTDGASGTGSGGVGGAGAGAAVRTECAGHDPRSPRPLAAAFCRTGRHARVASAFPHFGEEDCLRGWKGSGTIFFSMCNLRCVFCQNWDISQRPAGREMTASQIAARMIELQAQGCHNINFVTPEHVVPQVVEAIAAAVPLGLNVPLVYNTSAYDQVSSLRLLDGLVDIYMPDFKFWSPEAARDLAKAKDYPQRAREAIREMHRQVGVLKFGTDGLAKRGVLLRHLVMPGQLDEARAIFRWIADELSPDTYVNIMEQYRPDYQVGRIAAADRPAYAAINRRTSAEEVAAAYAAAREAGLWRFDRRRCERPVRAAAPGTG